MPNAISFSLFGYHNQDLSNNFPFASYFRGLSFNIKMAELIYPGWTVHCILDKPTYEGFQDYFDYHVEGGSLAIDILPPGTLCGMMLQRMRPIFSGKYDRVLCRDLDSLVTYKERQAVEYWISTGRVVHCMTDSVSHNIALMGGMVGFMCAQIREILNVGTFEQMVRLGQTIDYKIKGADQTFLNRVVLPLVSATLVEHYLLGLPQSFRGECYNYIQDVPLADVPPAYAETNSYIEHLGADGYKQDKCLMFFDKYFTEERKRYYAEIEDQFKEVFYWRNEI